MKNTNIVSADEYNLLKQRHASFEAWRNGRTSYHTSEVPQGLEVTNDERTKIELYEFVQNPPAVYFAYVSMKGGNSACRVTTWMGETLGESYLGNRFQCPAFNGHSTRRQIFTFKAINGKNYYGTYYDSSGNYCRLKMCKN